ncbi:MAG: GAK system ATP-grasp enzyme [candidate division Zixibacteria bacterium]|nr:GAK system ATP-grasp enzyme [candidate division Zixibacteria bacterium]
MKKIAVVGKKNGWSSEKLAETVLEMTGHGLLIEMDKVSLDLKTGKAWYRDTDLTTLDALMIKKIGGRYSPKHLDRLEILRYLHERGLPVFSSPNSIMRVLDRLSCTVSLRLADIPMPPTTITEDIDEALDAVERYGEAVFKPLYTSKARGMKVIERGNEARRNIINFKLDNPLMYIQQKIDLNGRDLGVVFLGGEYLTTYARKKESNSWTTSTYYGGKYETYEPKQSTIDIAQKANDLFKLDFTSVDVVETDNGPVVFEVSAFGGFRGIQESSGMDAARLYVEYVLKRLEP